MRLRIGVTHPLPFLKNAGVIARNLNDKDTEKVKDLRTKVFDLFNLLVIVVPNVKVTDTGLDFGKGFGFMFTLSPK